ncbi:unnamed protein product [Lactuca virosa]|uniref:Phytocyanin domain-containing protein n=1 Tax=Lactuca virosa TaxID=75947 RepID=A0AAU9M4I3_9ASTR|nr:unnamed protein product [Lactuca virosa]
MSRSGGVVWLKTVVLLVVAAAMLTSVSCRSTVCHLIGGKELWKPNQNYTDWSLQQTFYVGDWLHFVYNKEMFTVLEVNETSYTNCSDEGLIFNVTGGFGSDVIKLTQPKTYYSTANGDYCYNNDMKVAVNVVEIVYVYQPPPPMLYLLPLQVMCVLLLLTRNRQ